VIVITQAFVAERGAEHPLRIIMASPVCTTCACARLSTKQAECGGQGDCTLPALLAQKLRQMAEAKLLEPFEDCFWRAAPFSPPTWPSSQRGTLWRKCLGARKDRVGRPWREHASRELDRRGHSE
jgi:hypothetical protein